MDSERLDLLIDRHFDGDLSPEEFRTLDEAIARDPEAALLLRRRADEELAFTVALGRPIPAFVRPTRASRIRAAGIRAAAAILILAAGLAVFLVSRPERWSYVGDSLFALRDDGSLDATRILTPGVRYYARSGSCRFGRVEMEVRSRAVFIAEPSARGEPQGIALSAGYIRIGTRGGGRGVLLRTEKGTLRDIGTIFDVKLNDAMEEKEMIARIRANALPVFVAATVLSGSVAWESQGGEEKILDPASGTVNLAYDPSLGTIGERDGIVHIRPVNRERWTLADEGTPIEPGDWIKTAARGANAAEIRLKDGARLVIGPGALIEAASLTLIRLHSGEIEVRPIQGVRIRVEGPGGTVQEVEKPAVLRARDERLAVLDDEPRWLAGYRGKATAEAMGSLLADIDGRKVPLSLGYHKVAVDIRDQIARTVVEESFVNHTDGTLEGVFYFPLPQDASISGFGMWIGDELVEADVVEKERAREIYEEILREKRDPGLLEWTGGNIFKARVYPILPHGEKRIRITYTEVLPKEGNTYRYLYALQSEILRLNPLKQLELKVTISSAQPIASVSCPSHVARIRKTDRSAQVEFSAQQYSPSRGFEVRIETAPNAEPIVLIPHRRGDEGYFMVLLATKGEGAPRRLLGDGEPLDLIIIADTSGSMTQSQLDEQRSFIASLLESLSERDRFNLLAFDVAAVWAFPDRVPANAQTRERALDFIEQRGALGWTDLELAFQEAIARARKETHVVYVGDGIVTKGDADPVAFANHLKLMYTGQGSFHAIGVGSTYDLTALRAIASLGQGSFQRGGSGRDAAQMAASLLAEIAAPSLRDIQLTWDGIRVARVYPETLPNLPAGREQFILGRYLVEDRDQKGTLRIAGTLDGKPVSYDVPVSFPKADEGNSFIPRFWARMHLDYLLAQGRDPATVEKIIALSEEFQIITPYTSFLVLESDADRERFQVKKRFRMRGGEEFFAEGRERATYDLERQQMLAAKRWRQELRRQFLSLYDGMGKNLDLPPTVPLHGYGTQWGRGGLRLDIGWKLGAEFDSGVLLPELLTAHFADDLLGFDLDGFAAAGEAMEGKFGLDPMFVFDDSILDMPAPAQVVAASAVPLVPLLGEPLVHGFFVRKYPSWRQQPQPPFSGLFPAPGGARPEFAGKWPEEIRTIIERCNRRAVFAEMRGGLHIGVETDEIDGRGRTRPSVQERYLISAAAWAALRHGAPTEIPTIEWTDAGWRGSADLGRLLGSRRKAEAHDATSYPSPIQEYFESIEAMYAGHIPSLAREGDIAILKLVSKGGRRTETRIRIDTRTNLILEITSFHAGKPVGTVLFGDFVSIAGASFPQKIERRDADGKTRSVTRIAYQALDGAIFAAEMGKALAPIADAILLNLPLPKLGDAKTRVRDGKAGFEDRWVLINHFASTQRWDEMREHAAAAEKLVEGKPGLSWIRLDLLRASRRNEEARALALDMAKALAAAPRPGEFALAGELSSKGSDVHIERLQIIDALQPVFARLDPRLIGMKTFREQRIPLLAELGRSDEVFALRKELAELFPDDPGVHIEYAGELLRRAGVDAAIAHLDGAIAKHGPWTDGEAAALREHAAGILYGRRALREFLAYADRWLATGPKQVSSEFMSRIISAHVMLDREVEADRLLETWLAGARGEDPDPVAEARFEAALGHALSEGADLHTNRIDERWRPILAALAREFARSERRGSVTSRMMFNDKFQRTDEIIALRREFYREIARDIETLPAAILSDFWNWANEYTPAKDEVPRDALIDRIFARWEKEEGPDAKQILADMVARFGGRDRTLSLRRKQLAATADDEARAQAAAVLFDLLLDGEWKRQVEDELVALLPLLGTGEGKPVEQAQAIARIVSWLVRIRVPDANAAIPDREKKNPRELKALQEEARRMALDEIAATLRRFESAGLPADLIPFIRIERLTIEAERRLEPARVVEDLKAILSAIPEPPTDYDERTPFDGRRAILAERCVLCLAYLATRPDADAALAEGFLALLRDLEAKKVRIVDARTHLYKFLVVLDRAPDVEAALRAWAEEGGEIKGNAWRIPYAYVLAEQGKLAEAIRVFEGIEKVDELGPAEYRTLAGLYMALDDKAKDRAARIRAHEVTDEWGMRWSLNQDLEKYRREGDGVPEELDEDVLLRFGAILRKSSRPQNHIDILRAYYEATKDFRLLEALPEAVIGQTAAKIYPYLEHLGQVIELIGDEATADALEKHLAGLCERARTDVDRRALRLLEFLVERRAADQANGAGPHGAAALDALRQAYKGTWADGEPLLLARYLASVGKLVPPLREEQLRQLRSLHDGAAPRSPDRFAIGTVRAQTLWASDRREEAIQVLGAAIGEIREERSGLLPEYAFDELGRYASYLLDSREFVAAERVWRAEIARPYNEGRRRWLALQLYSFHATAIARDGETTIGRGSALYRVVRDEIAQALGTRTDEGYANELVGALCSLFRAANDKNTEGVAADLADFAFRRVPEILRLYQYRNGQGMVGNVAQCIRDVLGPRDAIAFLVARAETEPAWLRRAGGDFWAAHAGRLTEYRAQAKEVGDLEPRLLAIVLAEIERDLTQRTARDRGMYHDDHEHFWREKAEEFFRTARKVLETRRGSQPSVTYIADYFADGLGRLDAVIDALLEYHRRDGLAEGGEWQLVQYLHRSERFAESIPFLAELVGAQPGNLEYRVRQMRAFFRTGRPQDLEATRAAADAYWREGRHFGETTAESLGSICLETRLFEWAVKYYGEAIALRTSSQPNRGAGDGTLANYYGDLARAYAGLGRTKEAVDSAAAAIVIWGQDNDNRKRALESLLAVLREAKDLDVYVEGFEAEVTNSKKENPTIRKALGRMFLERKEYAKAVRHIEAAIEVGPADREAARLLIEAHEKGGNPAKAAERLLALARQEGHEFDLYRELGDRYAKLDRAPGAERAYTTLAEMSANESEGHAILARIRVAQKRFAEAAAEWRHVIRIRSKEPAGYLALAEALIGAGDPAQARAVLEEVLRKDWPPRFGETRAEARKLLDKIPNR